ncbi:hypothetical protein ACFZCP_31750 [Streptomyces sp. NPDC007971]|uniref:hypothetical protein n=1 Tax=Streptomyces sp. NPDC007971 TaxID=3364799 RepID=UPI0036E8F3E2
MTVPTTDTGAEDRRSLHERIAADLRDEIMSGDLAPGAGLPSTARLKARFDASLSLPSDPPVLRTLRVVYSDDDRPVEATVMVKAGHLYELQYEFTSE